MQHLKNLPKKRIKYNIKNIFFGNIIYMNRTEYVTSACALINAFFWSGFTWLRGLDIMALLNITAVFSTLYMNYFFMRRRDRREQETFENSKFKNTDNDWK